MKRRPASPDTLKFLVVAIIFVVLIDQFYFQGTRPYVEEARQETAEKETKLPVPPPAIKSTEPVPVMEEKPKEIPPWKKFAVPVTVPTGMPTVTIIIDDLGEYPVKTKEVTKLPGPLTMAFLPYPRNVVPMVEAARQAGHEIMVHMPMEANEADLDKGDYVLRGSMISDNFEQVLDQNLSAFDGYVGINNHMGSALTQDKQAMRIVMAHLQKRGLLFVDSRTIASSVAADVAADFDVPHAVRDLFLDNDSDEESVMKNLERLERIARKEGHAIAICHPKAGTLAALKKWLPTLQDKGLALVPASFVIKSEQSP